MSDTTTRGVRIQVRPRFIPEQSDPDNGQWLFAYHITIRNDGGETVQLISRHWVITDGEGKVEEVRGPGVVGYQPVLKPGEEFEYTSGCPLATPVGTMHGEFNMIVAGSGEKFDARIEPFRLAVPKALN
ncbi:MAG: Co2+/Mg2+ efflux protein ApaG [Gammaproteobacteria bacterium]